MAVPETFSLRQSGHPFSRARTNRSLVPAIAASALAAAGAVAVASAASPAVPIVALIASVLVYVLVIRPEWAVPLAVFLLWIDASGVASISHGAPSAVAALIPLLLVVPFAAGILRRDRFRLDAVFMWMVAILVAEIAATVVNATLLNSASAAPGQTIGTGRIIKFVEQGLLMYLLLINVVRTPRALRTAAWAIIAGGVFLAVFSLGQDLGHRYDHSFFGFAQLDHAFFIGHDDTPRAQGPLGDANYYAQILLPSFALAVVAVFRETRRRARIWAGIAGAVIVVAMVFTYSRGAALAVGVLILLLALFRYLRARHLVPLAALAAVILIAFPSYANRLASIGGVSNANAQVGSSNAADLSIQQRATENAAAWLAIQDHPLFGVGPGGFPLVYQHYAQMTGGALHNASRHDQQGDKAGEAPQRAVPNILLSIPADQGVMGLLAFIGLMACTIVGMLRARRPWVRRNPQLEGLATGYLLALIMYLVCGLFLALAFERYLWALVALCGATTLVLLRDVKEADWAPPRAAAISYGRKWGRTSPGGGMKSAIRPRVVRTPLMANERNEHE